jgi:hypothetical protein
VSVDVILQGLGWASVIWLVTVEMLIRRGRLPAFGPAFRAAGCAAATCVVAASAAEKLWPVAVLGVLWLRTEVFGHRRGADQDVAEVPHPDHAAVFVPGFGPRDVSAGGTGWSSDEETSAGDDAPARSTHLPHLHAPHLHLPHPRLPHPHVPHPHMTRRFVNLAFRIEMAIVIAVASVLFVIWGQQQREKVGDDANRTVCHWAGRC